MTADLCSVECDCLSSSNISIKWQDSILESETEAGVAVLFDLLFKALTKMASPSEKSSHVVKSTSANDDLLCEIFESRLIRETFIPEKYLAIKDELPHTSPRKRKAKGSSTRESYALFFSRRIGELVSVGVHHFPELKTSSSIQSVVEQLLRFDFLKDPFPNESVGKWTVVLLCG